MVKKETKKVSWLYGIILPITFIVVMIYVEYFPDSGAGKELIKITPLLTYAILASWSMER